MVSPDPISAYRFDGETQNLWCRECPLLNDCGGLLRTAGGICPTSRCAGCIGRSCDRVCFGNPDVYAKAYEEVGGFGCREIGRIPSPREALPLYMPMIQHGKSRSVPLAVEWAAVPLSALLRRPNGRPATVDATPGELRKRLMLSRSAKLLLIGIGHEREIEPYWQWRRKLGLPQAISALGFEAAVPPNFSLDLGDPRPQHLHNRKRSLICAEEWAAKGIPTVPCVQAVGRGDYEHWRRFLASHPEVVYVAREFQTGLARRARGLRAIDEMDRLQAVLRRPLKVVAVGGFQYAGDLARKFDGHTIVDSTPFMKALNRQRGAIVDGKVKWHTELNGSVDALLVAASRLWSDGVAAASRSNRSVRPRASSRSRGIEGRTRSGQEILRFGDASGPPTLFSPLPPRSGT